MELEVLRKDMVAKNESQRQSDQGGRFLTDRKE